MHSFSVIVLINHIINHVEKRLINVEEMHSTKSNEIDVMDAFMNAFIVCLPDVAEEKLNTAVMA